MEVVTSLLLVFMLVVVLALAAVNIISRKLKTDQEENPAAPVQQVRRVAGVRNPRRRLQQHNQNQPEPVVAAEESDEDNRQVEDKTETIDGKIGAKKRAKLEAKAEKKAEREAAQRERDQCKKREKQLQEERDKQSEKERIQEQKREEIEKKEREDNERREYEEYIKMKEAFSVEEEGFVKEDSENENLLLNFINHIKQNKVVVLEDLAACFGLKTANAIQRIKQLQADGNLTGVIDDRGKFIYISKKELEEVALFVKQRGRVSISELVEHSNRLIDLNPSKIIT